MIVADLDGTLLNSLSKVTNESKEYLTKLKEKGFIIVIATGRIFASVMDATEKAEFANYIISDTGAYIYNVIKKEVIFKSNISKDIAKKILNQYNDDYLFINICEKNIIYKYSNLKEKHYHSNVTMDKDYILNNCKEITKISVSLKTNDIALKVYNKLVRKLKDVNITLMQDSFSDRKWIDIMPKDCSKFNGIQRLANYLNISNDDIICFGDGLNDKEMLEKCGFGVALKNALLEVKKVAKDITSFDHNHNGVINYLKDELNVK